MKTEMTPPHQLHLIILGFLAALLLAVKLPAPAEAASFDCSQAAKPLEKMICADADLSRLDDDMSARYRDALAKLSPAGQSILRQGQRDWLSFMRTHCQARIGKPASSFGRDALACLREEYKGRMELLNGAAQKIGPYLFSRIDKYFLVPSPAGDENGSRSGFVFADISLPRIDSPNSEDIAHWNTMAEERIRAISNVGENEGCDLTIKCIVDSDEDLSVGYAIDLAQPGFISMSIGVYSYGHGMPHGYSDFGQSNFLLAARRELLEDDLFITASKWRGVLIAAGLKAVTDERPDLGASAEDIDSLIGDLDSWSITSDFLIVQIPLWLSYGYANGSTEIQIPWRDLKPYLRPDLPITLNLD